MFKDPDGTARKLIEYIIVVTFIVVVTYFA
jgi:hypothetical protein